MITLLDKQGKEIQEQDKIMERIEEFYSELYDSDQRKEGRKEGTYLFDKTTMYNTYLK